MGKIYHLYVLINVDEPVYVGLSCNVQQRKAQHRSNGKVFTRHIILESFKDKQRGLDAERAIIKYLSVFPNINNVNGRYIHLEYSALFDIR